MTLLLFTLLRMPKFLSRTMPDDEFSYDDWFSEKLAPGGDVQDGCHPSEVQAMKDYLYQKTTAPQAAQAITYPVMSEDEPENNLYRLWGLLGDCLVELPSKHIESLLALLQAIESLPEINLTKGEKLWKGLGSFGHMWYDNIANENWRTEAPVAEVSERDKIRHKHVRTAEIEARIVRAGIAGFTIDEGYKNIADALESSNALLDFEVPAAAKWLVICGQNFRQDASRETTSWGLKRSPRQLWNAPSDKVMTLERWDFWKQRLEESLKEPGVVREAVMEALEAFHE